MKRAKNSRCTSSICEQSMSKVWMKRNKNFWSYRKLGTPKVLPTDGQSGPTTRPAFAKATQVKKFCPLCKTLPDPRGILIINFVSYITYFSFSPTNGHTICFHNLLKKWTNTQKQQPNFNGSNCCGSSITDH